MNVTNQEKVEILKEFFLRYINTSENSISSFSNSNNYSLCSFNYYLELWNSDINLYWNRDKFNIIKAIIKDNKPKRFSTKFKDTVAYQIGYYWPRNQREPRIKWIKRMIKKYSKD